MFIPEFVRSGNNYNMDEASLASGFDCETDKFPSRTVQSQKDEADINVLVKRFGVTGQLPQNVRVPTFEDFGDTVFDFQTAQNAIIEANRSFMAMPAEVRSRFGNDPQAFVAFCSDEKNLDEMRKLGLAVPKVDVIIPPPMKVEIVSRETEDNDNDESRSYNAGGRANAGKTSSGDSGKGSK